MIPKDNLKASIVIPTYNASQYLDKCLKSIETQDFSKNSYEVIIADGGSTDTTLNIIKNYRNKLPIKLIKNEKVDAESGKFKAIKISKGKLIILLDSDNEIVNKEWLKTGVEILENDNRLWGIESPWMLNKKDNLVNQYFTLLKIADPLARMLNPKRIPREQYVGHDIYKLEKKAILVTGANGFFWRKSVIEKNIGGIDKFEEVNFVSKVTKSNETYYGILKELGIYHYYCDSVSKYFSKRIKIAKKFTRRKGIKQATWVDSVSSLKLYLSVLYLGTFIGPILESFYNSYKNRNLAWIYHSIVSFITVSIYAYIVLLRLFKNEKYS